MKSINLENDTHHILKTQAHKEGLSMKELVDIMTKERVKTYKRKK